MTVFAHKPMYDEVDGVEYVYGNILDQEGLADVIAEKEVVYHLASVTGSHESFKEPAFYMRTNVEGTVNVLQAASNSSVLERFILAGSDAVYGDYPFVEGGIDEEFSDFTPNDPYSISKLTQKLLCRSYYRLEGLPLVVLRLSSVYGPG